MTLKEAQKLQPNKSHVRFASGKYKVAGLSKISGAIFILIYDEPPSSHTDMLNADNVEFVKEWV